MQDDFLDPRGAQKRRPERAEHVLIGADLLDEAQGRGGAQQTLGGNGRKTQRGRQSQR